MRGRKGPYLIGKKKKSARKKGRRKGSWGFGAKNSNEREAIPGGREE